MGYISYIGIGSNLGDKVGQCEKAITEILKADQNKLLAKSSFFKTKPLDFKKKIYYCEIWKWLGPGGPPGLQIQWRA